MNLLNAYNWEVVGQMSLDSITLLVNDLQDHAQEITELTNKISYLYEAAVNKQNTPSFTRRMYLFEHKNLETLIAAEEQLASHVEFLQSIVGRSDANAIYSARQPGQDGEANRGDR